MYATVFTFQSLKSNYGSYIITFIIIIYLICLILFLAKYYLLLKVEIAQLVKKIEPQSSIIKQKEINQNKQNKSKRNKTFKKNKVLSV
jgi:Na+-transporting NADH:ubiquinone oxidoreductase subunit NqrC